MSLYNIIFERKWTIIGTITSLIIILSFVIIISKFYSYLYDKFGLFIAFSIFLLPGILIGIIISILLNKSITSVKRLFFESMRTSFFIFIIGSISLIVFSLGGDFSGGYIIQILLLASILGFFSVLGGLIAGLIITPFKIKK